MTRGIDTSPAQEFLQCLDELSRLLAAPRKGREGLKDMDIQTLQLLQENGTMVVGDLQRATGVLAAQMSRIMRKLECSSLPLVTCTHNRNDRRKMDVDITPSGTQVLKRINEKRAVRLAHIPPEDLREVLPHFRGVIANLRDRIRRTLRERQPTH